MGIEDQMIIDLIAKNKIDISLFTLDTGRLFPESYDLIQKTNEKYKINIKAYFPDSEKVEKMTSEKGLNLFYDSLENRKQCCYTRKVIPLKRALSGNEAWITGIRKEQSQNRGDTKVIEWDEGNQMIKINPLWNLTEREVWDFIKENSVPYNELHDKNFPSIGCAPCTRAVKQGEDPRTGRWWWEDSQKECGLHMVNGKLVRGK
ncbi:UNVERIFIED_CONTAM: hypothetical protein GTU68_015431 [Idotea baltica]|nr:hypothetical protein [Idotea baltica]